MSMYYSQKPATTGRHIVDRKRLLETRKICSLDYGHDSPVAHRSRGLGTSESAGAFFGVGWNSFISVQAHRWSFYGKRIRVMSDREPGRFRLWYRNTSGWTYPAASALPSLPLHIGSITSHCLSVVFHSWNLGTGPPGTY
ncbi:hypothetical protein RSAG8_02792, partial [Rhizoctonia solani AG-8 WAC10335]